MKNITSKLPENAVNSDRRTSIKSTLAIAVAVGTGVSSFPAVANTIAGMRNDSGMALVDLVNTLRDMGNTVCDAAALRIEKSMDSGSNFSLHLRSAGLNFSDATSLAMALRGLANSADSALLSSFSVSYNRELSDLGTIALARSLPATVQEIGFVDCNFGDDGALALLEWAKQSSSLKMICIEQNNLSKEARLLYQSYTQSNPGATVFF